MSKKDIVEKILSAGYEDEFDSLKYDRESLKEILLDAFDLSVGEKFERITGSLEKDFNDFIVSWCSGDWRHLLDNDDNDGERFRKKLRYISANCISRDVVRKALMGVWKNKGVVDDFVSSLDE